MDVNLDTQKERRAFRHSPLEVILLALVLVGLAFMAKTIFSQPDTSVDKVMNLVSGLQKRTIELSEITKENQRQMTQVKESVTNRLNEIDITLKLLESRLATLKTASPSSADTKKDAIQELQTRLEGLNERMSSLKEQITKLEVTASREETVEGRGDVQQGERAGDDSNNKATPTANP